MSRLMTEDALWWFAPGTKFSGLHSKAEFLATMAMLHADAAGSLEMEFYEITAEGDRVAIVAKGSLLMRDGRVYRSNYSFLLHIRSGKISSGKAFLDAIHANEIFGPPMPDPVDGRRD
jgi:ketosteroid isomerase-like protein